MGVKEITLLDELPKVSRGPGGGQKDFWKMLIANPGKWAEWPGSSKTNPYQLAIAATISRLRPGVFEGAYRQGKSYLRCVAETNNNNIG